MRISQVIVYFLLFPGLGIFYFALMIFGGINVGRFELEDLRIFGSPSLGNLVEIPIVGILGLIVALSLFNFQKSHYESAVRIRFKVVFYCYICAVVFYLLMPTLPE